MLKRAFSVWLPSWWFLLSEVRFRAYLAGVGARGADPVQQAQPTLGVGVGHLAARRVPGQTANREAFLVLLPAAEARNFSRDPRL